LRVCLSVERCFSLGLTATADGLIHHSADKGKVSKDFVDQQQVSMPKERQIITPSIKVKRLARLFESSRSPSKAMTSKKVKNVRREKISRIRNAMNEELSSENENTPSQQHDQQVRPEPVVAQPMGRQEQVTAAAKEGEKRKEKEDISTVAKKSYEDANEIMKNFLSRGAATAGAEGTVTTATKLVTQQRGLGRSRYQDSHQPKSKKVTKILLLRALSWKWKAELEKSRKDRR